MPTPVPRFYLYGDELPDVERSFLHVETIDSRSRLNDWTIRPHAHPDHHQLLLLTQGRGSVRLEDHAIPLDARTLVVLPALSVHEFRFQPGSDGWVVTIATAFLAAALNDDPALARPFEGPGACLHQPDPYAPLHDAFLSLHHEFHWPAIGRRLAVQAHLQRILVAIARLTAAAPAESGTRRRQSETVARFRALVETRFREQPALPAYASQLGVTTATLNAACRATIGKSALRIVHDRILIESKRLLLYTGLTVAEVALSLGFSDPAYFSRFFAQRAGTSPAAFRAAARLQP